MGKPTVSSGACSGKDVQPFEFSDDDTKLNEIIKYQTYETATNYL